MNENVIIAAIGDYYDMPGVSFIGVIRAVSLRRDGPMVAKAVLADSVFFTKESYLAELNSGWYQVPIEWYSPPVPVGEAHRSWDPLSTIAPQLGTLLPIDLEILNEAFEPAFTKQAPPVSVWGGEIPHRLATGHVWDAVALMRMRVRLVEEAIHRGSQGGGLLTVHRLSADVPIEYAAKVKSPHFEHMDEPAAENGQGVYKYRVPTGWWDAMLEVKRHRMGV